MAKIKAGLDVLRKLGKGATEVTSGMPTASLKGISSGGIGEKAAAAGALGGGAIAGGAFLGSAVGKPLLEGIVSDAFVGGTEGVDVPLYGKVYDSSFNQSITGLRLARRREENLFQQLEKKREESRRLISSLALLNPQKYNELLAGRSLPEDATVIGGSADLSLLEQFANQIG
tara:strand:+ start:2453 stop:2971 length:519 start_codon:yes stop_codon:yes gene_type:complete